jgi:GT2 family glycosyltransferase
MGEHPRVSAVVLAYGQQPLLARAVDALLASRDVDIDVVLVDNGGDPSTLSPVLDRAGVTLLSPRANLGFAAGSNLGAQAAEGDYVAFVNGDAIVDPDALARLVAALSDPESEKVAMATASVRLLDRPDVMNSAGNPVHFLGLSWAGGHDRPASEYAETRPVTSASGATTVLRRADFLAVGGFCETLFTYVEDTDLSLRLWQRGRSIVYVPDAVSLHDYEFGRNPGKFYLLERNRLFMVLTVFPTRVLLAVTPVLLSFELAVLALALKQGWGRQKVRGWWWLLRQASVIRQRRRSLRGDRRISDREFAGLLTSTLDPGIPGASVPAFAQRLLDAWWAVARRLA